MRLSLRLWLVFVFCGSLYADTSLLTALEGKIEAVRSRNTHPAFQHHLGSTLALCRKAWAETENDPAAFEKTGQYIQAIINGLDSDAGDPAVYLSEGRRSMIIGFESETDGDLQFYTCALPPDWNPERAYPLVVNLHGRGPDHPLFYVHIHFGTPGNLEEYNNKKSGPTDHILIFPWGRGNAGYTNPVVESDVLQCVRDVKSRFKTDESRQYLQGHSMGGFGSWYLGGKYADRWAAVVIQEGGYSSGLAPYAEQLSRLPIRLWSGDADEVIPPRFLYKMQGALEAFGGKPDIVLVPGWGHKPPDTEQNRKNLEWLLQHKKEKP